MSASSTRGPGLLLLIAGALAPPACGPPAPPPPRDLAASLIPGAPVVLVILDSLRADRTSLPGGAASADGEPRDTTQFLRDLARHAIVFENACTTASSARPALASLLSGRLPESHGCDGPGQRLSASVALLPEQLEAAGFDTQAVLASPELAAPFGLARGWSGYRVPASRPLTAFAEASLVRDAIDVALARLAPPPYLLAVHFMDCHPPWGPHPESDWDPLYGGTFDGSNAALAPFRRRPPSAANLARARDLYDGEIRWLDDRLRRLFDVLDERGVLDSSWIVVTSDHGIELWDHGRLGHVGSLRQEVLHVPLLVRPPGGLDAPLLVTERISLIDVAPTLLDLVGLPACPDFEGVSWLPFLLGTGAAPVRPVIACERGADGGQRAAVVDGAAKLIGDIERGTFEFYDLAADPGENRPQRCEAGAPLPPEAERLRDALLAALAAARAHRPPDEPPPAPADLPDDVRRGVQALGALDADG